MDDYNDKEVYISEEEEEQEEEQEQEQEHEVEKNNNEEKYDKRNGYYMEENHDPDVEEIHDEDDVEEIHDDDDVEEIHEDDVNHTYEYDNEKYVHKVEDNHLTDNDILEEDEENDQKRDEDLNEEEEYEHDSNHNNIDIDESNKEESEAEQNLKKEDYDSGDEEKKDNLQKNVTYANTIIKGGRNLRNLNKLSTSFDKARKEQNNNMNGGGTNFIKTLSEENNLQNNVPHGRRKRKVSRDLNLDNEYVYGTNLNFKHARNFNDDVDDHDENENNHDQNNNEEINEHNQNDDHLIHNDDENANMDDDDDDNNIINNNENIVKTNEKILNGKHTNLRGSHLKLKTNRTKKNKKLSNKLNRNIAKNVNKNNNGRYGNVGRAHATTTQGNEKRGHGSNDNAEYTTHNRGKNSTTNNFTNRYSRVTFNNNNEGTYYAGHNNNTGTSHGNRYNDPHEEAEPKKGKKKRVTEEGSKESGKINVGDSYQVSNLPNFFLCRSELMYKNYDTQENTNDQMCLSCSGLPCHCKVGEATLVYSPIMLERVRERCLKNRGYHKCVKNEIELSAYVQECAKSWKSNIDEWVPFSPEYAYKLLHYANYDPHKAISIMKSSEFSFRKIMDPPTRKYQNKWKPKDKREHISKNPFPSPLTIRTYLSKRHHNSGYHLR